MRDRIHLSPPEQHITKGTVDTQTDKQTDRQTVHFALFGLQSCIDLTKIAGDSCLEEIERFVGPTVYISLQNPCGHYMYRTVVTICTAQWSLYVLHSGHYMYHTVFTICTAQCSLYVPHSVHYMYRQFNIH
jgi:hypothetical protein